MNETRVESCSWDELSSSWKVANGKGQSLILTFTWALKWFSAFFYFYFNKYNQKIISNSRTSSQILLQNPQAWEDFIPIEISTNDVSIISRHVFVFSSSVNQSTVVKAQHRSLCCLKLDSFTMYQLNELCQCFIPCFDFMLRNSEEGVPLWDTVINSLDLFIVIQANDWSPMNWVEGRASLFFADIKPIDENGWQRLKLVRIFFSH